MDEEVTEGLTLGADLPSVTSLLARFDSSSSPSMSKGTSNVSGWLRSVDCEPNMYVQIQMMQQIEVGMCAVKDTDEVQSETLQECIVRAIATKFLTSGIHL